MLSSQRARESGTLPVLQPSVSAVTLSHATKEREDPGPSESLDSSAQLILRQKEEIEALRGYLAREQRLAEQRAEKLRAELREQLMETRTKLEKEAEAKLEIARRQSELEARARIEEARRQHEREARKQIEHARAEGTEKIVRHLEEARRIVADELEKRVQVHFEDLRAEERKRQKDAEAERESLRQQALVAQRQLAQDANTITQLKSMLKSEISARQQAENRLRELDDLRAAVEQQRAARDRQDLADREQLESVFRQPLPESPNEHLRAGGSMSPAHARERQVLVEWLRHSLANELEQGLLIRNGMVHSSPRVNMPCGTESVDLPGVPPVESVAEPGRAADSPLTPVSDSRDSGSGQQQAGEMEKVDVFPDFLDEMEARFQRDPLFFLRDPSGPSRESQKYRV
jgi:hypothetical protein